MPFKNYEELIQMASSNPARASELVKKAQSGNRTVVSPKNLGYNKESRINALKRGMSKPQLMPQDDTIKNRKEMNY